MEPNVRQSLGLRGKDCNRTAATLLRAVLVIAAIAIGGNSARAQQANFGPTWEAVVTAYLWLPWTTVDINPSRTRLPSASGTFDPGPLIDHLSWVPFMGSTEFRSGPVGIALDYLHAPVRAGLNTRNILFGGASVGSTADTGSGVFLYRPFAQPDQYLDIGLGVRVWGFNGDISLNQGLLPALNITNGVDWADPLIALRYHRELGNGFGATVSGDVGGFGLGAHIDWQVIGTVDYALKPGVDVHAGFRSLNFNYGLPNAGLNINMYGLRVVRAQR
jgi:hypothetical protein